MIQDFIAHLECELTVHEGDTVTIFRQYDEFYYEGEIFASLVPLSPYERHRGLFPTFCVKLSQPPSTSPKSPPRLPPKPSIGSYQIPALSNPTSNKQNSASVPLEPSPYYCDIEPVYSNSSPSASPSASGKEGPNGRPLPSGPSVASPLTTSSSPRVVSNATLPPPVVLRTSPMPPTASASPVQSINRKPSNPRFSGDSAVSIYENNQQPSQVGYDLAAAPGPETDDVSTSSTARASLAPRARMTRPSQPPPPPPPNLKPADARTDSPSFGTSAGKSTAAASDARKESLCDAARSSWHSLDDVIAAELASQKRAALQRCSPGIATFSFAFRCFIVTALFPLPVLSKLNWINNARFSTNELSILSM